MLYSQKSPQSPPERCTYSRLLSLNYHYCLDVSAKICFKFTLFYTTLAGSISLSKRWNWEIMLLKSINQRCEGIANILPEAKIFSTLQWRHNEPNGFSNQRCLYCLRNRKFRRRSKKTSKLCVTGFCVGNSPVTGEFPAQRANAMENVSIS